MFASVVDRLKSFRESSRKRQASIHNIDSVCVSSFDFA